ncbi:MAG: HAMP domain-containing histidine kinase [Treponema sp.]|nr:HAMP domain-containing histidine kinase [Treponema sp.]
MNWLKNIIRSKAFRIALNFSLLIALAVLFFSVSLSLLLSRNIRKNQNLELENSITYIEEQLLQNETPSFEKMSYYITFLVYKDGVILYTNDPFLPILEESEKSKIYIGKDFYIDGDLYVLYKTKKISDDFVIQVAMNMDMDYGHRLLGELPLSILLLSIPVLLVSFAASYFNTKQTMKPVKRMTEKAKLITYSNLDSEFETTGSGDEFDTLALTFNSMFLKLKSDFDREKQFTSDVSHELKTPISVIQGHANLIKRWGKNDPVQLEKSIDRLISETKSMESIVENLLVLSRIEGGRVKLNFKKNDIFAVFERLKEDTLAWNEKILFSEFRINSSDKFINCDEELLYEALTIIVSNSVKYGDKELLQINLGLNSEGSYKIISITDNGPGINPDKLENIFERFYRCDEAHNRSKGGSGLGLAIVKTIMTAHKGYANAQSNGKEGTTINLFFPVI